MAIKRFLAIKMRMALKRHMVTKRCMALKGHVVPKRCMVLKGRMAPKRPMDLKRSLQLAQDGLGVVIPAPHIVSADETAIRFNRLMVRRLTAWSARADQQGLPLIQVVMAFRANWARMRLSG
ncbi:hypothetical protein CAC42_6267 [Sphaceloma murrayae]|uniref:Uncharacterized protein n=1 Tax=Sphaceloma murrayae TaxID=2082308 RepID=A0A2K1QU16_9PEZI|nr:hypothetical protein CAC42_6267 [Sphaceloma murrayae]